MSPASLKTAHRRIATRAGEDGLIEHIFSVITPTNKWCVEFGAVDGYSNSNSWNLITNHQWSAVLIEGHPRFAEELKARYANNPHVHTLKRFVQTEGKDTLDAILAETSIPQQFDFLSIDIDGADYHIWQSLNHYQPRVVLIECNLRIPPEVNFVSPLQSGNSIGSSLTALTQLGKAKGYELIYAADTNALFVQKDLFPLFSIIDNDPATIGVFTETSLKVFQGFDGSLVLSGIEPTELLLQKKKPQPIIYTWHNNQLNCVATPTDRWRKLKTFIKKSPLYYKFFDSHVMKWYGKKWQKKKKGLNNNI